MTTIAYKNGVIAYDSRETSPDDLIVDDDCEKRFDRNPFHFFLCGASSDREEFIESYLNWKAVRDGIDVEAFVYCPSVKLLYRSSIDEKGVIWKSQLRLDNHYAMGSGRRLALAFMDSGMSAEDAVIATCKRDVWTGGTIRTFKIDR